MIDVSRDYNSLRIAAREYFEEDWAFRKAQRTLLLGRVDDRAMFVQKSLPKRTLAEGYYSWIEYLSWLSGMHEIAQFRDLTMAEAEGLRLYRAARDEWFAKHPRCGKCGAINDKFALACTECGQKFSP